MILVLSNGEKKQQDAAGHVIVPTVPDAAFNVKDPNTWECDRAWMFARIGQRIWTGKDNEIATIQRVE